MEAPDIQVDSYERVAQFCCDTFIHVCDWAYAFFPHSELQDFKEQDEDSKTEDISELAEDSKPEDLKEHSNNETPESMEEPPQSTGETQESTEETPQSTEETPQSTEETPESTEEPPQSTEETPQSMEEPPQSMEELPQSTGETPESMEETPESKADNKDEAPENMEETPQSMGETPENVDETPQSMDETPQSKDDSKDVAPQSKGKTLQQLYQEEEEDTLSSLSRSSERSSLRSRPSKMSSFFTTQPRSISPIFHLSSANQMIMHSPETCEKAPTCTSAKKQQASSAKTKQLSSQKTPVSGTKKKECKALSTVQQPPTTSSFSFKESFKRSGRKSKALYNLYTTFCDEGDDFDRSFLGEKGSLLAHGLTRACTIFSFIKNGKINAQNLLLTLHMLGIMMTVPEVQKVLKLIAMDEHGNLEFADFLRIVNEALPFSDTKAYCSALQIAQEIFRKIKKEMVRIEDLEPTLAALGVVLCPKIIDRALKRIRVTSSLNECANLERRSKLGLSESRPQSALEKEMQPHASVTFYDADQELALDQFRKGSSDSQRSSTDTKRPKTAPLPSADEEEKEKVSHTVEWPKVRPTFGYSSQDTLFPLTTSLSFKEEARKFAPNRPSLSPGQDFELVTAMQMRMRNAALEQKKKKTLSFPEDLPRRYDTEDKEKQKSDSGSAKSEGKEGSGGLSVDQFAKGSLDSMLKMNSNVVPGDLGKHSEQPLQRDWGNSRSQNDEKGQVMVLMLSSSKALDV
ncbi:hypothetical protein lerEdw1_015202 [Lerista edwardsae]|nr:hypothetical protein lerEdw1_015204 [Lerista edwardsae]KAJ6611879.1 hypothetical protein lerEdw1_015202 [Lerista edwardsae]